MKTSTKRRKHMRLIQVIQTVLKEQDKSFRRMGVDITIQNGNIFLRSFKIYDIDLEKDLLKGLTFQEEYAHAKENREPVFCFLHLEEIKDISVSELGLEYSVESELVKA